MSKPLKTKFLRSNSVKQENLNVDKESGLIKNIAIITEGPALGHGFHIDREFVEETVRQGNAKPKGLKSRFGHPNMSSTALGTFLGRLKNFKLDKNKEGLAVARADLQLSDAADPDKKNHVLEMADKEPDMFGASISFKIGDIFRKDEKGKKISIANDKFRDTPGPDFIELEELRAGDLVDSPAANPEGIFEFDDNSLAAKFTNLLDENPQIIELLESTGLIEKLDDIDVYSFFERYKSNKEKGKMEGEKEKENKEAGEAKELGTAAGIDNGDSKKPESELESDDKKSEELKDSEEKSDEAWEEGHDAGIKKGIEKGKLESTDEILSLNQKIIEKDEKIAQLESEIKAGKVHQEETDLRIEELNEKLKSMTAGFNYSSENNDSGDHPFKAKFEEIKETADFAEKFDSSKEKLMIHLAKEYPALYNDWLESVKPAKKS